MQACLFVFSIYGHADKKSGWLITKVDFQSILKHECTDADYETWAHTDKVSIKQGPPNLLTD